MGFKVQLARIDREFEFSPLSASLYDGAEIRGRVVTVEDGDSFTILIGSSVCGVRLAGVDAAELDDVDPIRRATANAAKSVLVGFVFGERIRVKLDPLQPLHDSYGHLIGYVFTECPRVDVNGLMVRSGVARAWRGGRYLRASEFADLELKVDRDRCTDNSGTT